MFDWMAAATGLGALGSIWGGNKARKAGSNRRKHDMELAEKYGIHPLAAWGTAGTPTGDGGYGTMAAGFEQLANSTAMRKAREHKEQREDDLMDRQIMTQMWMASKDAQVRRELEEKILGHKFTPAASKGTFTDRANEAAGSANEFGGQLWDQIDSGIRAVPEVFERGINWWHNR